MSEATAVVIEFTTMAAPVQAEGFIAGCPFYFRARHDAWTLAISATSGLDPADIDVEAEPSSGFFRSGTVAHKGAASFMAREAAESIIHMVAAEYLKERAGQSG